MLWLYFRPDRLSISFKNFQNKKSNISGDSPFNVEFFSISFIAWMPVHWHQGVTRRSIYLSWQIALLVYEPKCVGKGGGCGFSANENSCAHHVTWRRLPPRRREGDRSRGPWRRSSSSGGRSGYAGSASPQAAASGCSPRQPSLHTRRKTVLYQQLWVSFY